MCLAGEGEALFEERIVRVPRPERHSVLLRAADGSYLGAADGGPLISARVTPLITLSGAGSEDTASGGALWGLGMSGSTQITFWFDDGDLFFGHTIMVDGHIDLGLRNASIVG